MSDYLKHFGFTVTPFSTSPDPRFAHATIEHQNTVTKIAYYVAERMGVFLLKGPIGTGKTTIGYLLLDTWMGDPTMDVAYVTNPSMRLPSGFLRAILAPYGVDPHRNYQRNWDALQALLITNYTAGKTTVLVIDEAQTISSENLETLTHITNLQTHDAKLIQIVLLAQPNFDVRLVSRPALNDRIASSATLNPLSFEDTLAMLDHRLKEAGGSLPTLFPGDIPSRIYKATQGIPRRLCVLCDNALVNAFTRGARAVDEVDLTRALNDLSHKRWGEILDPPPAVATKRGKK